MINGFEEYTKELNKDEIKMLPIIAKGLNKKRGEKLAVTNEQIATGMKSVGHKIGSARVRKLINVIRRYSLVNFLIATSKGYYVASERKQVVDYIESLKQREEAINQVRTSLEKQLAEYDKTYPDESKNN